MLPRILPAILLVLSTALAGCFGGGGAGPTPTPDAADDAPLLDEDAVDEGPAFPTEVSLWGCTGQQGFFFLPPQMFDAFDDMPPPGFEIARSGPGGTAILTSGAVRCDNATLGDEALREQRLWFVGLAVVPPPQHRGEGVDVHFLMFDQHLTDRAIVALLHEWHVDAHEATIRWSADLMAPAGGTGQVGSTVDGWSQDLYLATSAQPGGNQGPIKFRLFSWEGRENVTAMDMEAGALSYWEGTAKHRFDPFGTDPFWVAFWALGTAHTTGLGAQFWWTAQDEPHIVLRHVPAPPP